MALKYKKGVIIINNTKSISILKECTNELENMTQEEFKQRENNIKEYIFIFDKEVFKVYAHSPQEAKKTFLDMCAIYSDTENEGYIDHWGYLANKVINNNYQCIVNEDFIGVRKV